VVGAGQGGRWIDCEPMKRLHICARPVSVIAVLMGIAAIALSGPTSASALKTYQCQHPVTTGQEASRLKHVSPAVACKAVRALARFIKNGSRPAPLYKCVGLTMSHPGRPVLKIHRLAGWNLRIDDQFGLTMFRGRSSFSVSGTDFPLNCT
jgi:hypothetical protein